MSDFFQLFNPGARHTQQQRDLEKMLVVDYRKGGWGPKPLDLESGKVTLYMPNRSLSGESEDGVDAETDKA
ncbi:MAG: DUF6191 domain-containing protein [Micropruina sp.]|uniref:DUF6191 domain-containing protein n=1 Tax=Micropruina sp. TaxID=2737536 RepID=UPI0039E6CFC1